VGRAKSFRPICLAPLAFCLGCGSSAGVAKSDAAGMDSTPGSAGTFRATLDGSQVTFPVVVAWWTPLPDTQSSIFKVQGSGLGTDTRLFQLTITVPTQSTQADLPCSTTMIDTMVLAYQDAAGLYQTASDPGAGCSDAFTILPPTGTGHLVGTFAGTMSSQLISQPGTLVVTDGFADVQVVPQPP
jgi:hypothetical protein